MKQHYSFLFIIFVIIPLFLVSDNNNQKIRTTPGQVFVGDDVTFTIIDPTPEASVFPSITWDFKDGGTQNGHPAHHFYKEPGPYRVTCTWNDNSGARQELTLENFQVQDRREVVVSGGNLKVGKNVQFQAKFFGANNLKWNFDDGTVENAGKNHNHRFQNSGNYTVSVLDYGGSVQTAITCQVNIEADNRRVTFEPSSPRANQPVNFNVQNFAVGNLTWDFDDGTVETRGSSPSHVYNRAGNFNVKVWEAGQTRDSAVQISVNVAPDNRNINITPSSPRANQEVAFNAQNFGVGNLTWDFNDGTVETKGSSNSHVFGRPGNFNIQVWDASQSRESAYKINLNIAPDNRRIDTNPPNPTLYKTITFQPQNFQPGNLDWDFGDGGRKTASGPVTHQYTRMGNFIVKVSPVGANTAPVEKQININRDARKIQAPNSTTVGKNVSIRLINCDANQVDWEFGPGDIKRNAPLMIQHVFQDPGQYTIKCMIRDQSTVRETIRVNDNRAVVIKQQYLFENSDIRIETRNFNSHQLKWDYGDGPPQQGGQTMTHKFNRPGSFTIRVYDFNGQAKVPVEKRVTISRDNRKIETGSQTIFADCEARVEARSFIGPGVKWNFGDGTVKSGSKTMTHIFRRPGNYNVTAVDFNGRDTKTFSKNILVKADTRTVDIPAKIIAGEPVKIKLNHAMGGNFTWKFQDGDNRSGLQVMAKKFQTPGLHEIRIEDNTGNYPPIVKKIKVLADTRSLTSSAAQAIPGDTITFTASNFLGPMVKWNFGDGKGKNAGKKTEVHTYEKTGKYKITAIDYNGKSAKTFSIDLEINEVSQDFQINTVELAFSNGKYYAVVPRNSRPPAYYLKINVNGRGILNGKWLQDGSPIGLFSLLLRDKTVGHLRGNRVVRLPVSELGLHRFTFEFTNYDAPYKKPFIKYFVTQKGAIDILYPEMDAKITVRDKITLKWSIVKKDAEFYIAVSEIPFQFLEEDQYNWIHVGKKTEYSLDLKSYKPGAWIYWIIREKTRSGRILTTSEYAAFRMMD